MKSLFLRVSGLSLQIAVAGCCPSKGPAAEPPTTPSATDEGSEAPASSDSEVEHGSAEEVSPSNPSPVRAVSLQDRASLIQVWVHFASDWNSKDRGRLARWSATRGVFLLDNPGAFVRVALYESVPELLTLPGQYDGARIKSAILSETVDEGPLPKVACEDPEGLPKGVFLGVTDASFVTTYVEAMAEYDLAPKGETARLAEVEKAYAGFEKFLVHDTRSNVSFVFAVADGAFVVVAVNAVVPCSA